MSSCLRSLLNMFFLSVSVPPAWIVPSGPSCRSVPVSTDTQQRLPHSNHRNCEQWLPHQCLPPRHEPRGTTPAGKVLCGLPYILTDPVYQNRRIIELDLLSQMHQKPVSYTHLTLPTILRV